MARKRGGGVLKGVNILMHAMVNQKQNLQTKGKGKRSDFLQRIKIEKYKKLKKKIKIN